MAMTSQVQRGVTLTLIYNLPRLKEVLLQNRQRQGNTRFLNIRQWTKCLPKLLKLVIS